MKQSVCLTFRVHKPPVLKAFTRCQVGVDECYFDEAADQMLINKLADECYLPANAILLSNIQKTAGSFKVCFSISGTMLERLLKYRPDVVDSFDQLVKTGSVELLAETYYNSLSSLYSAHEFERQVEKHSQLVQKVFDIKPTVFRNTELLYDNKLANHIYQLGYKGILCEGVRQILKGRTPNKIYAAPGSGELALLLRNSRLSDDIAFRFDDKTWNEYPLSASKFAQWIHLHPVTDPVINLFMDYETFGIHKNPGTGILNFLQELPQAVLTNKKFQFSTASEVIDQYYLQDIYDVPSVISWESEKTDIRHPAPAQEGAIKKNYSLERFICNSNVAQVINSWRTLQDANYLAHPLPDETQDYYNNIITDLEIRLIKEQVKKNKLDFIPFSPNAY